MRRVSVALVGVVLAALVDLTGVPMLRDAPTARAADLDVAVELARGPASAESCSGHPGCGTLRWQAATVHQTGDDDDDGAPSSNGVMTGNVVQVPVTNNAPIQLCNNNVAAGVIGVPADALNRTPCLQHVVGLPEVGE